MTAQIVVETKRLLLRKFTSEDAEALTTLQADPVVMKFLRQRNYQETLQTLDWIGQCYEKYGFGLWATIHKTDNKLIGRCGLIAQNIGEVRDIEIAYLLSQKYWGRGLATEAASAIRDYGFEVVGCKRLISLIDRNNIASQKVAAKVGLIYEKQVILAGKLANIYAINAAN